MHAKQLTTENIYESRTQQWRLNKPVRILIRSPEMVHTVSGYTARFTIFSQLCIQTRQMSRDMDMFILWRRDPLLRSDSVNNSGCYGEPAAVRCAVASRNNRRYDAGGVFCRSAPRLYDLTDRVLLSG
jgi:hypothetical protein